jgi:hypothetical protein
MRDRRRAPYGNEQAEANLTKIFLAYPSQPASLGANYEEAIRLVRSETSAVELSPWTELQVSGQIVWSQILQEITRSDETAGDITVFNENVIYEIGYAIGLRKSIALMIDASLPEQDVLRNRLRYFDSICHSRYANCSALANCLKVLREPSAPLYIPDRLDRRAPVYVLDSLFKEALAGSLISSVKKTIVFYRSFDPLEQV